MIYNFGSYRKLNEEDLSEAIQKAKEGSEEAYEKILSHYESLIKFICRKYRICGYEKEDLYQECAIKLLGIIQSYDPTKSSFSVFFYHLINNNLYQIAKNQNTRKYKILNNSLSISDCKDPDSDCSILERIGEEDKGFQRFILKEENEVFIEGLKKYLSKFELEIFKLRYIDNLTFKEIETIYGYGFKSIDNARVRIMIKIKRLFERRGSLI